MRSQTTTVKLTLAALAISGMFLATRAFAAEIKGQVMGGGAPIAQSTVTLWAASSDAPKQLAQTKTDNEGRFEIRGATEQADASLYLVATGGKPGGKGGDDPAIALLAVVGSRPPANVVINEMTTLASVSPTPSSSRARRSRAHRCSCGLPRATYLISPISKRETMVRRFWMLSTVPRPPRWPTSPHYPAFWQRASRG